MKITKPSYEILSNINGDKILKNIELIGRTCYKSEDKITDDSSIKFVKMLINSQHLSVIEHEVISVRFIFDRGVSHEIVRHRLSSFSQESTRYCNYSKDKFNNHINYIDIKHHFKNKNSFDVWVNAMENAEVSYLKLIENGETPQIARSVLPNSLKTEIVVSANLRQWRLIFKQRTAKSAHPQMREIMIPLLDELKQKIPIIFDDIKLEYELTRLERIEWIEQNDSELLKLLYPVSDPKTLTMGEITEHFPNAPKTSNKLGFIK